MRILQVVPCYLPGRRYGGPIASVHGLSRALVERGHEVTVFTTDLDGREPLVPPPRDGEIDGVRVRYFEAGFPRRLHRSPAMDAALTEGVVGFDLCHLHGVFAWPTLRAARAAERFEVPYVLSPRGMLVEELLRARGRLRKELWIRALERRTVERAALVHATSEREAADLAAFPFRWPKVVTIPNGVEPVAAPDPDEVSPRVREALARDDAILFLGRLSWKKGLARLVEALARMERGHLVVAGADDGYGRELERRVAELELESRVTLLGEVAGADRAALLTGASVLALVSDHENFGNVAVEAMSAGLPVVVSRAVGAAPWVTSSGAGRVADRDARAVARALAEILADEPLHRTMSEAGRRVAHEDFAWPALAERFESAYAEVLAGPGFRAAR